MKFSIRLLYLYLFSFIGLIITVIGTVRLLELGLKVYIFKGADVYEYAKPVTMFEGESISFEEEKGIQERENKRQRQREVSGALAMLFVGFPLYKYHWKLIKKESKNRD